MAARDWLEAFRGVSATVVDHLPAILGSLLLIAAGWVVAKLLALVGRSLTERLLERISGGQALANALDASGARAAAPRIVGAFVFWIVLTLFVVATVEILGLPVLTDLLGRLAAYLPNIIAAIALVIGGLVAARLARGSVVRAVTVMRLERQAESLAGLAQALVVAVACVMALEQLGLKGRVLELMLAVSLGSILLAAGLAFALGARTAVANIVAARYVTQLCRVGQAIRLDDIEGTVIELTSTAVVVQSREGRVVIPAARFHEGCPLLLGDS